MFDRQHNSFGNIDDMVSKIKHSFYFLVLIAILFLPLVAIPLARSLEGKERDIRVLVVKNAPTVSLSVQGAWSLIDETNGRILDESDRTVFTDIKATRGGIQFSGKVFPTKRIAIEPSKDAAITVNKRRFRGHITIMASRDLTLNIINVVDLEQYIKGVLYHEISHKWPIEAIKAQAVAARSYAVYSSEQSKGKDFDVTNDIYSQVYGGKNSERYRTGIAVDETRGEILVYDGKVLPAFFHATCGGMTESANEVWNINIPALQSELCPYCKNSPHMHWKKNFRLKDIQTKLNQNGYHIGAILTIEILRRNASDRIQSLRITARDGSSMTISGKDFRNIIGPNDIKSNSYEVVMRGYYVDFYGRGWGHGVGLCQWGALGMAQLHFDYQAILKHYYPGSTLEPIENVYRE